MKTRMKWMKSTKWLIASLCLSLIVGCAKRNLGPSEDSNGSSGTPELSEGATQRESGFLASSLGLRWIRVGKGLDEKVFEIEPHFYQNQILYPQVFHLEAANIPRPTELFLTWPDGFNGADIVLSGGNHFILNGNNQRIGNQKPIEIQHEFKSRRWIFSVDRLIREADYYSDQTVTPADTQIVVLELVLSNQRRVEVEVKFRIDMGGG